ncbi:alpha/beta hydrolase [Mycobacterium sp. CVI_P3]|uniref:Alpha/beta hydrolase n=1 Tax=Mycobacterium pinniadriaticum TaxID=2994102 RepID=A0ABT3SMJ3_9MYCO|nr:alpha/beta hydrolase [Mycobacterium pinniadriaticum]MCX2934321.1 alpha/beta hydrolase [Mycobacterium pinniadriaticum]MCX2940744.1 alpha/beta hydrolase [Mycobacterium pinniadriaticum]
MTAALAGTLEVRVEGTGPDVVVLPSFVGPYWTPALDELASSFRVHLLQLPGFGDFVVPSQARRVLDLASVLKVALADAGLLGTPVIGHSFGGWLAIELAMLAQPQKLVLVDALGFRIKGEPREDIFDRPRDTVLDLVYANRATAPTNWGSVEDRRNVAALAKYGWNPYLCDLSLNLRASAITSPTLVLWGEKDRVVPATHAQLIADTIPDARVEVLADAGHDPFSDDPSGLAAAIKRFLTTEEH